MADTPSNIDPRDVGTPDDWIPRHPELVRLTGRHPFNCEPPLEHLRTFITPTPLHYVRNHSSVPKLDWESHTFCVDGLVDYTRSFTMTDLLATFSTQVVSFPVLLVCAGNRRKEQNMIKKSIGFNWGAGAASTAVWTGVPLHCLLAHCGVDRARARFVWFEGADVMPKSNYGTCIPASVALDPSCDVLVAWKMNGELLAPDHGFPLRLIVPGHIGGRMVKWLARIHVSDHESDNPHHLHDNRVLPSHIDAERATAENWWVRPEFAIQELNVNSVLLSPAHMETVDRNNYASVRTPEAGDTSMYRVSGYAYSGGGRRVIRVEITLDDGFTWDSCKIVYTEKPNAFGKMWCWVQYELDVPLERVLEASEICVRAWDASMNTQPEYPTWNVMGMMNNPWFRVKIKHDGPDELHFEHPTQVGGAREGWMAPGKGQTRPTAKRKLLATADEEELSSQSATEASKALPPHLANLPIIPADEVAKHTTAKSCWFICRGLVYDATEFLEIHPGGASSILLSAGMDCTDEFESIHSTKAWKMLEKYCIGVCGSVSGVAQVNPQASSTASAPVSQSEVLNECVTRDVALDGSGQRVPLVLISKEVVSRDSRIFRFALPGKHMKLGLPIGNHVMLFAKVKGKTVVRAYTPISSNSDDDAGFVSFLIKIYFAGENPAHPEGGTFSQHLESLHLGSQIEMKGPIGHFTYYSGGIFSLGSGSAKRHARKFGFIAGGTGITPVYQVVRAILTDSSDCTKVAIIYCVRTSKDLLLRAELEQLRRLKPESCELYLTMTEMDETEKTQMQRDPSFRNFGTTRISFAMIERVIGADATHIGMCGPPGMIQYACVPALKQLGYDPDSQLTVF